MEERIRYTKDELELCKNTFKDNQGLLLQIRNVFFQFPYDEGAISGLSPAVRALVRKAILPEFDPSLELFQQADITFALKGIKELNPGVAYLHIRAKDLEREYLEQQFRVLCGLPIDEEHKIKLTDLRHWSELASKVEEDRFVGMLAYLNLVNSFIESRLFELETLAKRKELTEEELKEKAKKDSAK